MGVFAHPTLQRLCRFVQLSACDATAVRPTKTKASRVVQPTGEAEDYARFGDGQAYRKLALKYHPAPWSASAGSFPAHLFTLLVEPCWSPCLIGPSGQAQNHVLRQ